MTIFSSEQTWQTMLRAGIASLALAFNPVSAQEQKPQLPDPVVFNPQKFETPTTLNAYLLAMAQADVINIVAQTISPHAATLQQMEARFARLIQADPTAKTPGKLLATDPLHTDIITALGYDLAYNLALQGYPKEIRLSENDLMRVSQMKQKVIAYDSPYPLSAKMTNLFSLPPHLGSESPDCKITNPANHTAAFQVFSFKGFSTNDLEIFIQRHEAWHCLHMQTFLQILVEANSTLPSIQAEVQNKIEAFADLGAAGDMIREGYDPDIAFKIGYKRMMNLLEHSDAEHVSTSYLSYLHKRISEMGVEAFRAMPDEDLPSFYLEIVKEDFSGAKVQGAFHNARGPYLAKRPETNPAITAYLDAYDPQELLEHQSIVLAGAVTPKGLIAAYADLYRQDYAALRQDPTNEAIPLRAAKLYGTFRSIVTNLDYVDANLRHGIDPNTVPDIMTASRAVGKLYQSVKKPAPDGA